MVKLVAVAILEVVVWHLQICNSCLSSGEQIMAYGSLVYFSQKTGSNSSCKLLSVETICIYCQILFSGKNITDLPSAELAQRVVKINMIDFHMETTLLIVFCG